MPKKRPINLNLMTIKFPITAISSILHRVSGFVLFLLIPLFLWGFALSMDSEGFDHLSTGVKTCWVMGLIEWVLLSGLIFHIVAGIRHLCMDMGYFEGKESGKLSALSVIIISAVLIIAAGGWLL